MSGRYQTYPEYKNSGFEWLSIVPGSWISTRLKFEALINMGQSPNSDDCNQDGHGLPFLQGNAEFGVRSPSPKQYCDIPRKVANKGQLLFSVRAPVGALNIADQKYGIGRGLCAIANHEMIASDFLWWLIPVVKSELNSVSTGSTFEAVSAEQVENVVFFRPSLNEQRQIANFLDHETAKIDTLIEKQQQLIKLLKEKRQAVISHAVTKGLNPNAPMRDSGVEWLGEVPEHWDVSKVKFYCSVKGRIGFRGYTVEDLVDKEDGALVIGASEMNLRGEIILNNPQYISWEKYYESPEIMLDEGMVLVVQRGSTVGKIANILNGIGKATINPSLIVLRDLKLNPLYMSYSLMGSAIQSLVKMQTSSTAIPMISQEQVGNYWQLIPPKKEQDEIEEFINSRTKKTDDAINYSEKSIELLNERRTALISAAVTGKIDVRNWQAPEPFHSNKETYKEEIA